MPGGLRLVPHAEPTLSGDTTSDACLPSHGVRALLPGIDRPGNLGVLW